MALGSSFSDAFAIARADISQSTWSARPPGELGADATDAPGLAALVGPACQAWVKQFDHAAVQGRALHLMGTALPSSSAHPAQTFTGATFIFLCILGVLIGTYVAPMLEPVFDLQGAEWHWTTTLSMMLLRYVLPLLALLIGLGAIVWWATSHFKALQPWLDRRDALVLRLPGLSQWSRIRQSARLAAWLALSWPRQLEGVTALTEALSGTLHGRTLQKVLDALQEGTTLPKALAEGRCFLPGLAQVCDRCATLPETEAVRQLQWYADLAGRQEGPSLDHFLIVMHVLMGGLVGFVVIATYLPIFRIGSLF